MRIQLGRSISRLFTALHGIRRSLLAILRQDGSKAGLFPFNPDRVLGDIQKFPAGLTVAKADKVKVGSYPEDEVLQTPVTAEALTSLHSLIKQDTHALDERSK